MKKLEQLPSKFGFEATSDNMITFEEGSNPFARLTTTFVSDGTSVVSCTESTSTYRSPIEAVLNLLKNHDADSDKLQEPSHSWERFVGCEQDLSSAAHSGSKVCRHWIRLGPSGA
jgi:hypothetical protein